MTIYQHPNGQGDFREPCGRYCAGPILASWNGAVIVIGNASHREIRDAFGYRYHQAQIAST